MKKNNKAFNEQSKNVFWGAGGLPPPPLPLENFQTIIHIGLVQVHKCVPNTHNIDSFITSAFEC